MSFIQKVNENKWYILITILLTMYGVWQWGGDIYSSVKDKIFPEPIYIVKSRIDISSLNYACKTTEKDEYFATASQLWDICGEFSILQILNPTNMPKIIQTNKDFIRFGQERLSYSISIATEQKNKIIPLRVYSDNTDFSIQKMASSVTIAGKSIGLIGLNEIILDIDLSKHSEKHKLLFDIIPEKDGEIKIECINNENCKRIDVRYILSNVPPDDNEIVFGGYFWGKMRQEVIKLPERNFNKTTIYYLDLGNWSFRKISVENKSKSNYTILITSVKCNQEGRIYLTS